MRCRVMGTDEFASRAKRFTPAASGTKSSVPPSVSGRTLARGYRSGTALVLGLRGIHVGKQTANGVRVVKRITVPAGSGRMVIGIRTRRGFPMVGSRTTVVTIRIRFSRSPRRWIVRVRR